MSRILIASFEFIKNIPGTTEPAASDPGNSGSPDNPGNTGNPGNNDHRVGFHLQGALAVGNNSHFHHHTFRNRSEVWNISYYI